MPYVVTVQRYDNYYVYGLFESRKDACRWAENHLDGFDWHVAQYTIVERLD